MKVITDPIQMQKTIQSLRKKQKTAGLVPTMGALHEGHLSLVKRARKENDVVVVSIFVNPTQFGPNEDYLRYPRPFSKDKPLCKKAGVDFIFAPKPADMYPEGYLTFVNVEKMSEIMCGKFRPGHFRGVATVVTKLFNICQPDKAYFGLKDFQQLKIIERFTKDLNIPVKIVPCPIVREKKGLALSSRNQYLSKQEHEDSLKISAALKEAVSLVKNANSAAVAAELALPVSGSYKFKDAQFIKRYIVKKIKSIKNSKIDYVVIADPETLEELKTIKGPFVIAVAVWVGKTRLIDNIVVDCKC